MLSIPENNVMNLFNVRTTTWQAYVNESQYVFKFTLL